MKKIYFVRHAESEGNVGPLRQGPSTPLSKRGIKQAEFVAKRFETILIDRILTSPQKRAEHTADEINKVLKKPIEYTDLLFERRRPSVQIGMPKDDPLMLKLDDELNVNFHNAEWRHSDEETFEDLKSRVLTLFAYVETFPEDNILLVSHGIFLRMFTAVVIMGAELTSHQFWNFLLALEPDNAGITVFEQTKYGDYEPRFRLVTWNDHAHLGEVKDEVQRITPVGSVVK